MGMGRCEPYTDPERFWTPQQKKEYSNDERHQEQNTATGEGGRVDDHIVLINVTGVRS